MQCPGLIRALSWILKHPTKNDHVWESRLLYFSENSLTPFFIEIKRRKLGE
jgi:hypothetical protein